MQLVSIPTLRITICRISDALAPSVFDDTKTNIFVYMSNRRRPRRDEYEWLEESPVLVIVYPLPAASKSGHALPGETRTVSSQEKRLIKFSGTSIIKDGRYALNYGSGKAG